jgi:hypothetical protein
MASDILVATETFSTEIDGDLFTVHKGQTRVREDHPLVKQNPGYFRAMDDSVHYDVEQATKAPGEKRGGKRTKAPGEKASE